jgi:DinB superfamily
MNARLNEIIDKLNSQRQHLLDTVDNFSDQEMVTSPEPNRWSPSEILHHLYLTETQMTILLEKQIARGIKKGIGPDSETHSVLTSLDKYNIATPKTKLKAPTRSEPQPNLPKNEIIKMLSTSRQNLLNTIENASNTNLSLLFFPHPMMGKLNMYQWLIFIGQHEDRHRAQIKH